MLLALGVTLYPLISNLFAETHRSMVETRYVKAVEKLDDGALKTARAEAETYNEMLRAATETAYTKDGLEHAAESYDELLNVRGDGIMGYVEIPKISVDLPIYHGTDEATLSRGVGHLMGSSLPVGGLGTHCVLTGHSGLAGQKMFSDLDQLKLGDVFYIKTLDETLAYMILNISTVLPEDTSKLGINPAQDSVTLVTCTPYGINSHRLLVRGERIELPTAKRIVTEAELQETSVESTWTHEYLKGIAYGGLGIAALLVFSVVIFKSPKGSVQRKKPPKEKPENLTQQRKRGKHEA